MYCGNCGKENADGARFCLNCGAPLNEAQVNEKQNDDYENNQTGPPGGRSSSGIAGKLKEKKLIVIASAALIIILAVIIIAAANHKTKIDVSDYIVVEVSGVDGYGSLDVSGLNDWQDAASEIIYKKYSATNEKLYLALFSLFDIDVTYEADAEEGLSNGDTVTITVTVDDSEAENLPFRLTASVIKYEVEGLQEVQTIDLFENVEVTYSGCSPYAEVDIDGSCDYIYVSYYCNEEYVSNGDTVTIYAEYDEDELLEDGYIAESDSMEVEVSGLSSYITELSQIPDETMEEMKAQAEDTMEASVASGWNEETESFDKMEYLGCYFLTSKSSSLDWGTDANRVILVYEVSAWNEDVGDFAYYTAFEYTDIILLADGTCSVNLDECEMTGDTFSSTDSLFSYYYHGYQKLDSLFSEYVTSYTDDYNYESTVAE